MYIWKNKPEEHEIVKHKQTYRHERHASKQRAFAVLLSLFCIGRMIFVIGFGLLKSLEHVYNILSAIFCSRLYVRDSLKEDKQQKFHFHHQNVANDLRIT